MQTIAVFATILAVASAASIVQHVVPSHNTVVESHRVGGAFSYSASEGVGHAVVSNVVSPVATTYSVSGVPVQSTWSYSGYPVVANTVGNVAVVRSGDVSGVHNVVVPTSVVQAGTPANTYKTIAGVSPLSGWPVTSVVV